jgi:hypothetical protein
MKSKKVEELLKTYKGEGLDYSYITRFDSDNKPRVQGVKLRVTLPIASPGGFEHVLADMIAQKYGVTLEEYNVNRGTDDLPLYTPIFSVDCNDGEDINAKVGKIRQARDELQSRFRNLAEFVAKGHPQPK